MLAKLITIASDIGELTVDKLEDFKREKFPKIKDSVARATKLILLFLFISVAIISIGIYAKASWLIVIGGLIQISILTFAYAIAELISILSSIMTFGKHSAKGIKAVILGYSLVKFAMIIILLLLPARANLSLLPAFLWLSFFVEFVCATNTPKPVRYAVMGLSIMIILGMFSPGGSKFITRSWDTIDSSLGDPRLFQATPEAFASGNVDYYNSRGELECYRCFDDEKRYILYKDECYCTNDGTKALPISASDRTIIKKLGEKIISPRCLIGGKLTSSSVDTNKPTAAPAYVPPSVKKAAPEQQFVKQAPVQVTPPPTQTAQATPAPVVDMSAICRHRRGIVDWGDSSSDGTLVNIDCSGNSVILRDTDFGTIFNLTKNTWSPGTGGGPFYFHMEPFSQGDTFAKGKITIASGTVTAYLREEPPPEQQQQQQPAQNSNAYNAALGQERNRTYYPNQPRQRRSSVLEGINTAMRSQRRYNR